MTRTLLISLLGHIALLATASALFDVGYLFGNGRLAAALAMVLIVLTPLPVIVRAYFRLLRRKGSRGQAPLWALPLGQLACAIASLLTALWIPHAGGHSDFWKNLLDVSPGPFTDLVVLLGFALLGGSLASFTLLCVEWLRHGMALEAMPDLSTRVAMHGGAAGLLALVMMLALHPTENMEYMRAWKLYSWDRHPQEAAEAFGKIAARAGSTKLADNALLRLALISRDLGQGRQALEALRQLQEQVPNSPLVEDALFIGARLLLATGDRAGARRDFERVLSGWPASYLADDALLALIEMARQEGDATRGAALSERLRVEYRWRFAELDGPRARPRYVRAVNALTLTSP